MKLIELTVNNKLRINEPAIGLYYEKYYDHYKFTAQIYKTGIVCNRHYPITTEMFTLSIGEYLKNKAELGWDVRAMLEPGALLESFKQKYYRKGRF